MSDLSYPQSFRGLKFNETREGERERGEREGRKYEKEGKKERRNEGKKGRRKEKEKLFLFFARKQCIENLYGHLYWNF